MSVYVSQFPNLLREWDYEKNLNISPDVLTSGSRKKVWWKCSKGHSWQTTVYIRTTNKSSCPYCTGKIAIPGENDIETLLPELIKEWDYEKNIGISPNMFSPGSGKKVWWKCKKGHSWQTAIYARAKKNSKCPYCSGKFAIPGENDIETLYPELMKEWDYEKNSDIEPNKLTTGSGKKVWWKCSKGHSWQAAVRNRTKNKSSCPECEKVIKSNRMKEIVFNSQGAK